MANIEADIRQLESLSNKDKNLGDVFYLNYCQAFYKDDLLLGGGIIVKAR